MHFFAFCKTLFSKGALHQWLKYAVIFLAVPTNPSVHLLVQFRLAGRLELTGREALYTPDRLPVQNRYPYIILAISNSIKVMNFNI